jgi:hypothetical protein
VSDEEVFSFSVMSLIVVNSVVFVADSAATFFFLLSFPQAVSIKEKIKIVVIIEIRFFIFVPPFHAFFMLLLIQHMQNELGFK